MEMAGIMVGIMAGMAMDGTMAVMAAGMTTTTIMAVQVIITHMARITVAEKIALLQAAPKGAQRVQG